VSDCPSTTPSFGRHLDEAPDEATVGRRAAAVASARALAKNPHLLPADEPTGHPRRAETATWNRKALQAEAVEGRLPAKPFRAASLTDHISICGSAHLTKPEFCANLHTLLLRIAGTTRRRGRRMR
jgi:hypothetical protein